MLKNYTFWDLLYGADYRYVYVIIDAFFAFFALEKSVLKTIF